jgi:L-aspartate oxidase
LVFGARIAEDIAKNLPAAEKAITPDPTEILISPSVRGELQRAMSAGAAVVRTKDSLSKTLETLNKLKAATTIYANVDAWETTNLYLLATAITRSALERTESRGSHTRDDFPESSDNWRKRIHQSLDEIGNWQTTFEGVFDDLSLTSK